MFADISGFTAMTEAHGDEDAADLAARFFTEVRLLLPQHGGEEVKTLGDAMMIRCDSAAEAVALGLRIIDEVGSRPGFPSIRVGLHTGPAARRDGDWYGATVNLAARVSAAAAGDEVLLTAAVAAAAGAPGGGAMTPVEPHRNMVLRPRGRRRMRNVAEPVNLFEASCEVSRSRHGLPIDPVCRMAVDPDHAAARVSHGGVDYQFCSLECVRRFVEAPDRYADAALSSP